MAPSSAAAPVVPSAPVQLGNEGHHFSGAAEAFPVVQRSATASAPPTPGGMDRTPVTGAPGTPTAPGAPVAPVAPGPSVTAPVHSPVVSLAPARTAPAVALPVQRAPATPAAQPSPAPVSALAPAPAPVPVRTPTPAPAPAPARVSTPRGTSVAVQRKGGGAAGSRGSGGRAPLATGNSSSGGGSSDRPPPSVTSRFEPRELKEDQMAELVQRLIGPMTRLLRTELRLDRERIGKLRDPRH